MENYYDVLGVEKNADQATIKKQYQRLARKYHPDRSDDPQAKEKFQKVNTAYQTLKDPQKRAEYDMPQPEPGNFRFTTSGNMGGGNLHDMLREAMGGMGGRYQQRQQQPTAQVNITLEEAFSGTTRTLNGNEFTIPKGVRTNNHLFVDGFIIIINVERHNKFQRAQDDLATVVEIDAIEAMLGIKCELSSIDNKVIKFSIPPGTQHGGVVRIAGKGMPNPEIDMRGDLLVQVSVSTPRNLTDEDRERIMEVKHRESFKA